MGEFNNCGCSILYWVVAFIMLGVCLPVGIVMVVVGAIICRLNQDDDRNDRIRRDE